MIRTLLLACCLLTAPIHAAAQTPADAASAMLETRTAHIVDVLNGEASPADVFTPQFNTAISAEQLADLAEQFSAQFGPLLGVESVSPTGAAGAANVQLRYQRAIGLGQVQLEAAEPYRVAGFRITDFRPAGDDPASVLEEIRALPGEVSVLLAPLYGSPPLLEYRAGEQMAIGSTFKLYVLSALARSIAAGERNWDDVVPLTARSFPSGQMQDWPKGAPVTLHTLASMMIAISDNTATDQLMEVLGREVVEQELRASGHALPAAALPLMTTREMFLLKTFSGDKLRNYPALPAGGRLAMLQSLAGRSADPAQVEAAFAAGPRAIDVEWFASAQDIARIFARLGNLGDDTALEILAINPSLGADSRSRWAYAGFKGGSQPGVLNLSWLVRSLDGTWHVLAMSWNNPAANLDHQRFELLAQRVLGLAVPE